MHMQKNKDIGSSNNCTGNKIKMQIKRILSKKNIDWRRMKKWVCFSLCAVLIALLLLSLFVWTEPLRPGPAEETEAPAVVLATTPVPAATLAPTPAATPEPTKKPLVMQDSFRELYAQNSDIVGWITLAGTPIDYPVMQTDDNDYYMTHDFDRSESKAGSLLLDFRCDFTNMYQAAHQIVYGHNMKNGSMLQALTNYEDESFFIDNPHINIDTLYGDYTFEVFSVYETPIYFNYLKTEFGNRKKWLAFIQALQDKSMYERDIKLSENDVVVTLSTCTNAHTDDMRFVVHARLVNPEIYDVEYAYIY